MAVVGSDPTKTIPQPLVPVPVIVLVPKVGAPDIVMVLVSTAGVHASPTPPGSSVVSVKVIVWAAAPAGILNVTPLGFAVGPAEGVNVPTVPLLVHVPVDAPPPIVDPVKVTVCALADWQTVTSGPASTVAAVSIVAVTAVLVETQVPFLVSA